MLFGKSQNFQKPIKEKEPFLGSDLFVFVHIYEPKEKGGARKRSRLPVAKSTFRDRLVEQSRKKSVKKKTILRFFLVSLQLEITRKSEKLTFQFEI